MRFTTENLQKYLETSINGIWSRNFNNAQTIFADTNWSSSLVNTYAVKEPNTKFNPYYAQDLSVTDVDSVKWSLL